MGYDFHVRRGDTKSTWITRDEWLAMVAADPELTLVPQNGKCFAEWKSTDSGPDIWFDWCSGNILTKWPSEPTFRKMLQMARKLKARVEGDDGEVYKSVQAYRRAMTGS